MDIFLYTTLTLCTTAMFSLASCQPVSTPHEPAEPMTMSHESKNTEPNPVEAAPSTDASSVATFAAGCFWGVEATFRKLDGVLATRVGYTGGHMDEPTYKQVCTDRTGHAEAVEVTYDPAKVSYEQLLEVFWANHDPTQLNRQGPDVGTQYRSAIFYHDAQQETAARASMQRLEEAGKYRRPIVTQIVPAEPFWEAEEYHQQYLEKRGLSSCHVNLQQ